MNKRYRELEKRDTDARRTYEKVAKKVAKLKSENSKLKIRVNKAKEEYEISKQNRINQHSEEDYKMLEDIFVKCRELNDFGADFTNVVIGDIDILENEFTQKNNRINELLERGQKLSSQIDKEEETFKELWELERETVTEDYVKEFMKKHDALMDERQQIYVEASQLIYERDAAKKKISKLKIKIGKYKELNDMKESMAEQFCKYKGVDMENIVGYADEMIKIYNGEIRQFNKYEMYNDLLKEGTHELEQLKIKLSVAKDKMEEAEYQFKEYKNMTNVA